MITTLFADRLSFDGISVFEIRPGIIKTPMTEVVTAKYDKMIFEENLLPTKRWGNPEDASGMMVRYHGTIVSGIDEDTIKRINKDIKAAKFKAKTQIEGDKIRVSSPSRDTLQDIITFVKEKDYDVPLQFVNYR